VNTDVVRNALGGLDLIFGKAKDALTQIEADEFHYECSIGYENPKGALGHFLEGLSESLLVVLEAAEMPDARGAFLKKFSKFQKLPDGLSHVVMDHPFGSAESPALTYAEWLLDGLRMAVSNEVSDEDGWVIRQLERMLRDTAAIVLADGRPITRELDLQSVMNRYLRPAFVGFTRKVEIPGSIKNFKADCGVRPIRAAVEFKLVKAKKEVDQIFSGIVEDTAGYKGSKEWTRFYGVIYQADPFMYHSDLEWEMKRIGASTWTVILLNGKMNPKKQRRGWAIKKLKQT
jgi:hypothetical protein